MTIRKRACVIGTAMLLLLTGCDAEPVISAQKEQVEISFSWWGNDGRTAYTIAAVQEFERLHPEIKVRCDYSEWSGYETRSKVRMISNTEADVMQINYAWLAQYSPDGSGFYDLQTLTDIVDLSNFEEDVLEYGKREGVLNALPIAMNTETVYINQTLYTQYGLDVPRTWDDLYAAAEVMQDEVYPLGMASKSAWLFIMAYAEQQSGKQFVSEDGIMNFGPEEIGMMLECYCSLVNHHVMPQVEYFDRLDIAEGLYGGTVAWVSDASNYCDAAIQNGYEMVITDYTADSEAEFGSGWYAKPATMYAVSKNTEHPKEAAMLLDYLLNSREMAMLQGLEKGIPLSHAARTCLEEEKLLDGIQYDASQKLDAYLDILAPISPYGENSTMIDLFIASCNAVLYDKVDVKQEAESLYQAFQEILNND